MTTPETESPYPLPQPFKDSAIKPAKAHVDDEKRARLFSPDPTAATEGWSDRSWTFTPRAEPAISFGGRVAEEISNLCYMFGVADDEESIEKALIVSSSAAIASQDSVHCSLVTIMVDSRALGHYFDDVLVRDLKRRQQNYVHLATPRNILTPGGALLDGTAEGVLQGLVTDNYGNKILVRVDVVVVPWIRRNLFSVMTAAKKGIMILFDYENLWLQGFNVTVPLQSKSGDSTRSCWP